MTEQEQKRRELAAIQSLITDDMDDMDGLATPAQQQHEADINAIAPTPDTTLFGDAKALGTPAGQESPAPEPPTATFAQPLQQGIAKEASSSGLLGMLGNAAEYSRFDAGSETLQQELGTLASGFTGDQPASSMSKMLGDQPDEFRHGGLGVLGRIPDDGMESMLSSGSEAGEAGTAQVDLLEEIKNLIAAVKELTDTMRQDKTPGGLNQTTGAFRPTLDKQSNDRQTDNDSGSDSPNKLALMFDAVRSMFARR